MQKNKAIITVGVSASGKSTWANAFVRDNENFVIICRDDIRREMMGGKLVWSKWNWKNEGAVTKRYNELIRDAIQAGKNIILADTNLNTKFRTERMTQLAAAGYQVDIKFFSVTLEEAWARDAQREEGVGHTVIYKQYQEWLKLTNRKVYEGTPNTDKAVLVDIDGTLAHMVGRRPFEWNRVQEDAFDPIVAAMVAGLKASGHKIIVLSGRDGICYDDTVNWLASHSFEYDEFFMRQKNDNRKDTVIKEEIFWNKIADNFDVKAVIDDRPSVCRMWMELGLKVINVGNPYVEF